MRLTDYIRAMTFAEKQTFAEKPTYVGQSVSRPDDPLMLTGAARFVSELDDSNFVRLGGWPATAHVSFVRSPMAHAEIVTIEREAAANAAGVLAVVLASDHSVLPAGSVFPEFYPATYAMPILAERRVRYVGEPVVAVVAETAALALDAAELVEVDYEPLEAVIDVNHALTDVSKLFEPGSWARTRSDQDPTHDGTNMVLEHPCAHDGSAFEHDVVLRQRFWNPRQVPAPIEPNGQVCAWDGDELYVWAANQRPHGFRDQLVDVYQLDHSKVHVSTPFVGGGFGGKVGRTPEEHVLPLLSQMVGRPVAWLQTRSEYFVGATQGRGEQIDMVLAGSRDGNICALRGEVLKDSGAYPGVGANLPGRFNSHDPAGPYDIAHVEFASKSVVTNAPQISAFRGAGRAPYIAALERIIDMYANKIGLDPADVRRQNLVSPDVMPFTGPSGVVFDEADYPGDLAKALDSAGYKELRADQQRRRDSNRTRQLGIGIATYHHMTVGGGSEEAIVRLEEDGTFTVFTGTTSQGHGHDATWAQLAADILGVDLSSIAVLEGSTEFTPSGVGAVGSRSMQTAGVAISISARRLVGQAKEIAASLLEASPDDIVVAHESTAGDLRGFSVAGVPAKVISWQAIAAALNVGEVAGYRELECGEVHDVGGKNSFPSGCHIAVVEVDVETGHVELVKYVGVDDAGIRVNPMIVEGQLHGGIAAGIGQVLGETMRYDEWGNPTTTNFADYPLPTADQLPMFNLVATETPTSFNSIGAKGVGESGIIGATPAVHNAVLDALASSGVEHLDLPCTPQRIWQAIQAAAV